MKWRKYIACTMLFVVLGTVMVWKTPLTVSATPESGESNIDAEAEEIQTDPISVTVPIYNFDIVNIAVPTSYAVALNPYNMPIQINTDSVSTEQIVSRNYGILNKSSRDKIATVTITIKDLNEGMITFVDSAEAALNAGEDVYAVYLAVVPADSQEVKAGGSAIDKDTAAEALANVTMSKAVNSTVTLTAGENRFSFKLSKAMYGFGENGVLLLDSEEGSIAGRPELISLAADGSSVTAFTFSGAMNPEADWTKLMRGIDISVMYTYENAVGDEAIAEGTGALVVR